MHQTTGPEDKAGLVHTSVTEPSLRAEALPPPQPPRASHQEDGCPDTQAVRSGLLGQGRRGPAQEEAASSDPQVQHPRQAAPQPAPGVGVGDATPLGAASEWKGALNLPPGVCRQK